MFSKKKNGIIGLDVGGSYIRAILFANNRIVFKHKIITPKNRKNFIRDIKNIICRVFDNAANFKIKKINIGIAGVLDFKKGKILISPNLKFLKNLKIAGIIGKEFEMPVKIDNDARCFTRAEAFLGAGKKYKNIVGITLGTGVGGGIIINKKMHYGGNFSAGEIGHSIIKLKVESEKLKVGEKIGQTFEDLASRKFLKRQKPNPPFLKNLAVGVANIVNILDPEIIILGGGIAQNLSGSTIKKIQKIAKKLILSPKSKNLKLAKSRLGEYAGATGAAMIEENSK